MTEAPPPPAVLIGDAFVAGLPVAGAALSLMASDAKRDTVYASDDTIGSVARLQYDLGEGPALTAFTTHRPVLLADLHSAENASRWPIFAKEVAALSIGALFTFPMQLGAITIGVCEAYRAAPGPLAAAELALILQAVDVATVSLLVMRARSLEGGFDADGSADARLDGFGRDRAAVHQATGMLTVQLGVGLAEAFSRLRAHSYAAGRGMDEVAREIVARRLRLEADPK